MITPRYAAHGHQRNHPARIAPVIVVALLVGAAHGVAWATDPGLAGVNDILNGKRTIASVDDLVLANPVFQSDTQTQVSTIMLTTDNREVSASRSDLLITPACGVQTESQYNGTDEAFPQQTRVARLFNQKNDVVVTATASATASGEGCKGNQNLQLYAYDYLQNKVVASATYTLPTLDWLDSVVADFDYDGLDDILIMNGAQAFVVTGSSGSSFEFGPAVQTGATRTPLGEPAVGDFNGDGILDVAWSGGQVTGGSSVSLHFASICPGPVAGTICDGAARFTILLDPLAGQPLTYGGATISWEGGVPSKIPLFALAAGNFTGTDRDDLLVAVQLTNGSSLQAYHYQFDDNLVPSTLDQRTLIPDSDCSVGPVTGLYATSAALDFFGATKQVVVGWSVLAFADDCAGALVSDSRVQVITFNASGVMTVYNGPALITTTSSSATADLRMRGLAVGGFSALPSSPQASDFNPQIASLFAPIPNDVGGYVPTNSQVYIYTLDVTSGNYTPTLSSTYRPDFGLNAATVSGSHNTAGSLLRSGDLQGRSVRLGTPLVLRESSHTQPFVVLGAPPSHVDYVQVANETSTVAAVINFSALPDTYAAQFSAETQNSSQSSNTQTTSYSHATMETTEAGVKLGVPVIDSVSGTVSNSTENIYTNEVSSQYNTYSSSGFDVASTTAADDVLWFTSTDFNVYYYPVLGQTVCPEDNANCAASDQVPLLVVFSGPQETQTETISGSVLEWYQPVEEPLQIFSYPWSYEQLTQRLPQAQLLSQPLSFFTDASTVAQSIQWNASQGMDQTSGTTNTHSSDSSRSVTLGSPDLAEAEGPLNASVTGGISYGNSTSISTLNTDVTEAGASSGVGISKPGTFVNPPLYAYLVTPYIFGQTPTSGTVQQIPTNTDIATTGVLQAAYVADPTDLNAGSWWKGGAYSQSVDVALNHPDRWSLIVEAPTGQPDQGQECRFTFMDSTELVCARFNDPDTTDLWDSEFYWMRGLMVTVGGPSGPQRTQATAGESVFLAARVYNYSLMDMASDTTVHVRFYRQPWDTTNEVPTGDSVLIAENMLAPIPAFNSDTNTTAPNWVLTSASFDSTGMDNQHTIFWVVVWAEDGSGNLIPELAGHGLTMKPGTLTSVADVPLDQTTYAYERQMLTTSFSNNVGYLHQVFYVVPAAPTPPPTPAPAQPASARETTPNRATAAARFSRGVVSRRGAISHQKGSLTIDNAGAMPIVAKLGEKTLVRAYIHSPEADRDGVVVTFYDGNPDQGGKAFDMEMLAYVKATEPYQVRVPYRARTCGAHDIVIVANHGKVDEARTSVSLTAVCDPTPSTPTPSPTATPTVTPTPANRGSSGGGCAIGSPAPSQPAWLVLGAIVLLLRARRRQLRAFRGDGMETERQ